MKTVLYKRLQTISQHGQLLVVALVFGVVGALLVFHSHAATSTTADFEAEAGTVSSPASVVSDSGASGGSAVKFTTASGGTTCPLPAYPNPSCVGVPAGTTFTNTVSSYTATTNGQVIDGWHITGGLDINASNVQIKNSQIDGTISNDGNSGTSFSITDSTVGSASTCYQPGTPSLWGHDFTAARVWLRNHQDGFDMGASNVSISDSLIQPCFLSGSVVGGDGYHSDGGQDLCGATCTNLTLNHNTIDVVINAGGSGNSALNLGSAADGSHMQGVTLTNNLFLGGTYTTDLRWTGGANWSVTGNRWVNGKWAYAAISTEGTCSHQTWSGNSIVTIDSNYNIVSTVSSTGCVD